MGKGNVVLSPQQMEALRFLLSLGRDYFEEGNEDDQAWGMAESRKDTWRGKVASAEKDIESQLNKSQDEYVIGSDNKSALYEMARYGLMEYLNGIGEPCTKKEWEDLKRSRWFGEMLTGSHQVLLLLDADAHAKWLKQKFF